MAGNGNTTVYANNGDGAVVNGGAAAQGDGIVAGGDVFGDDAELDYTDSFNEDTNITHGELSPILSASDHSEIEDVEIEVEFDD